MSDTKRELFPNTGLTSKFESRGLFNSGTAALHTSQAEAVWNGRVSQTNKAGIRPAGVVSVPLVSGALRYTFMETGSDNPWADFALLRFQDAIAAVRAECEERIQDTKTLLAIQQATTGVTTRVLARQTPHTYEFVLYTPYHGILLETMATWDNAVRHVLTMESTGKTPFRVVRDLIERLRNLIASALEGMMRDAGHLRRASVPITRVLLCNEPVDEVGAAAAKAAKSASATLAKKFGAPLPDSVLSGETRPEHRRPLRRERLSVSK